MTMKLATTTWSSEPAWGVRWTRKPTGLRLSTDDVLALRYYFTSYEADIGVASTFGMAMAAWAGVFSGSGAPFDDPFADIADRGIIKRANMVYRTLKRMCDRGEGRLVSALFLMFGYPRPGTDYINFGDVAPLAPLTKAVEHAREELALANGLTQQGALEERWSDERIEEHRVGVASEFWATARRIGKLEARIAAGDTDIALANKLAAWRNVLGKLLDAYHYDIRLAATFTTLAAADKQATEAAAIAWKLNFRGRREPGGRPDADAHEAFLAARAEFIREVVKDATQLNIQAAHAYKRAKE